LATNSINNELPLLLEFVAKVYWKKHKIIEVPVTFMEREAGYSKLKLFKEPISFIKDVIKLKLWHLKH